MLLCQAVPASDLVIAAREVASVADIPRRLLTLKLIGRELLADDVVRLTLMPPRGERLPTSPANTSTCCFPEAGAARSRSPTRRTRAP